MRHPRKVTRTPDPKSQTKTCPICMRPFHNRKKWASRGQWESIVYCSKACAATAKHSP